MEVRTVLYFSRLCHAHPVESPSMSAIRTMHPSPYLFLLLLLLLPNTSCAFATSESAFHRRKISCGPAPVWNKIMPVSNFSLSLLVEEDESLMDDDDDDDDDGGGGGDGR